MDYTPHALADWAGALSAWARLGRHGSVFFDNDESAYAARNAERLQQMRHKR